MEDRVQLVLVPGAGADYRQWQPQRVAFPGLLVPAWITPLYEDTLPSYAARLAETIPREKPLVLGGSSFGGMLACEMAKHLQPNAVIVIGSCRSPKSLPHAVRLLRPVLCRIPCWGITLAKSLAPLGVQMFRDLGRESRRLCATMFKESDPYFVKWAIGAILRWKPTQLDGMPISHIHGRRDRMILASRATADCVVPDGGHLINLSHVKQVNDFIRSVLAAVA